MQASIATPNDDTSDDLTDEVDFPFAVGADGDIPDGADGDTPPDWVGGADGDIPGCTDEVLFVPPGPI